MAEIFGAEHIIYLIGFLIIAVVSLVLIYKFCRTEKSGSLAINITAGVLLASIVWNRISIAAMGGGWLTLIPNSFCGLTSVLFSVLVLVIKNRNHYVFHCLVYIAIIGGILTLVYPTFIGQSASLFLDNRSISGMIHHSVSLYLAVLLLMTGKFIPSLKNGTVFLSVLRFI